MTSWAPHLASRAGPVYLAIADALADDMARGRVPPGTKLPTHRELADRLGVTVGTVTRAYAEANRRGLTSGEVGRGTFARGAPEIFAVPASTVLENRDDVVDLSRNHPSPLDNGRELLADSLAALGRRADLARLLEYAPDLGLPEHRAAGAAFIALAGLEAAAEDVMITNGSQHSLMVALTALLRPGETVLTEALAYTGIRAAANLLHLRLQGLPIDEQGLCPDGFEAACRGGVAKVLYTIPTLHNPTASIQSEERRREIARVAREHGVTILEDDVHGLLVEHAPPPIARFAPDVTCYLAGTSKTLAPGLRVGYVLSPRSLLPRLGAAVRATTWMATPLMAALAAQWIQDGTARRLLKRRRDEARARQKLAAGVLARFELDTHPESNHVWLHLPDPWRSETLAEAARRRGVLVTPAQAFVIGRQAAPHAVRVCLAAARDRDEMMRGLRGLVEALDGPADAGPLVV